MNFDEKTYTKLILYILSKSYNKPNLGKTVLCTLLYFIDFNYYEQYGKLLTEETYLKSKRGILPEHFTGTTQNMIDNGLLFLRREPYYNRTIHRYYLTVIPNVRFSEKERQIIDSSLERLIDNNATSMARYARHDPPFYIAGLGERIDCRYVLLRNRQYSIRKNK
jgi:hypothetical protein